MAPITTASNEETHAALLDQLDMHKLSKPFRNPNWKPPQRRNKNLKQILGEAQRAHQSILNTQQNSGVSTPTPEMVPQDGLSQAGQELGRLALENAAKQHSNHVQTMPGPTVTYSSISAAPSLKPKKKYCDITGLPAKYKDPKSGLYYHNSEIYQLIKALNTSQIQEYLALRGANTILK